MFVQCGRTYVDHALSVPNVWYVEVKIESYVLLARLKMGLTHMNLILLIYFFIRAVSVLNAFLYSMIRHALFNLFVPCVGVEGAILLHHVCVYTL